VSSGACLFAMRVADGQATVGIKEVQVGSVHAEFDRASRRDLASVVEISTVDDPAPGPREAVVAVAACGLCGTDLHILEGEFAPSLPVVPGHEFAGVVVAVGSAVGELAVGTRVAVDPSLYCNECHYCRIGHNNLCERWAAIGVTTAGGAAEYAVAPVANCVPLPEHVRLEDAALVEPLACAVRGYDVLTSQLGSHVLIYGSGTMGLMMPTHLTCSVPVRGARSRSGHGDRSGPAQCSRCLPPESVDGEFEATHLGHKSCSVFADAIDERQRRVRAVDHRSTRAQPTAG
jgi:Alcohol dehydrogenase GroES-like domain